MAYLNSRLRTPETCPVCGEEVPPKALACPECGADHNSGWKPNAESSDGTDLPDDEFDYREFVKNEFDPQLKPPGIKPVWWVTAVIILLAIVALISSTVLFATSN